MYPIMGKVATGVVTIIITDIIMEKYDVSAKIKKRYTQARDAAGNACASGLETLLNSKARTGFAGLAAKVGLSQGKDEGATSQEKAQEAAHVSLSTRFTIWEAGMQLRLARWAEGKAFKNVDRMDRAVCKAADHHAYCVKVLDAYKRNYIHTVSINEWAGPEDEDIPGDAYDQGEFHYV